MKIGTRIAEGRSGKISTFSDRGKDSKPAPGGGKYPVDAGPSRDPDPSSPLFGPCPSLLASTALDEALGKISQTIRRTAAETGTTVKSGAAKNQRLHATFNHCLFDYSQIIFQHGPQRLFFIPTSEKLPKRYHIVTSSQDLIEKKTKYRTSCANGEDLAI